MSLSSDDSPRKIVRPKVPFEKKVEIVDYCLNTLKNRKAIRTFLLSHELFLHTSDPLDKFRDWTEAVKSEKDLAVYQCSYGDVVDCLLAVEVRAVLNKNEKVNLEILRNLLETVCKGFNSNFILEDCGVKYGRPWAEKFAERHGLSSKIVTTKGTTFTVKNQGKRRKMRLHGGENNVNMDADDEKPPPQLIITLDQANVGSVIPSTINNSSVEGAYCDANSLKRFFGSGHLGSARRAFCSTNNSAYRGTNCAAQAGDLEEGGGINAYPQYFEKPAAPFYNPMFEAKAAVLVKMLEMKKIDCAFVL